MSKVQIHGDIGISDWALLLEMEKPIFLDGIQTINKVFSGMLMPDLFQSLQSVDMSKMGVPFISYGPSSHTQIKCARALWESLCEKLQIDPFDSSAGWLLMAAFGQARLIIIKEQ